MIGKHQFDNRSPDPHQFGIMGDIIQPFLHLRGTGPDKLRGYAPLVLEFDNTDSAGGPGLKIGMMA
jgi:hypothetical protein